MEGREQDIGERLIEVGTRLIRVESRVVQLMIHFGIQPEDVPQKDTQGSTSMDDIGARLVRVESRVVQLMNHLGVAPIGALPTRNRSKITR